jgi:hypothetical protein
VNLPSVGRTTGRSGHTPDPQSPARQQQVLSGTRAGRHRRTWRTGEGCCRDSTVDVENVGIEKEEPDVHNRYDTCLPGAIRNIPGGREFPPIVQTSGPPTRILIGVSTGIAFVAAGCEAL